MCCGAAMPDLIVGSLECHMDESIRYWFAAKRYGWGWGLPLVWEGWVVYIAWIAVLFGGIAKLGLRERTLFHFIFIAGMILMLVAVCYLKGEPPRWRWSD